MKWDRDHQSSFVEDRRGQSAGRGGAGIFMLLFWLFRRFGIAGVVVGIAVIGGLYAFGGGGVGVSGQGGAATSARDDELGRFVGFVLDDAQATWTKKFAEQGKTYPMATLVLFTGRVDSACGMASSAVGPFYCPRDHKVYIDLSFYQALRDRLGAPGDFAQAYVIAHEIGHHVSNVEGVLDKGRDEGAAGGSVRVELQADCYAGVWAHDANARNVLEIGDIDEAMRAAEAIGDDALQRQGGGTVVPETFTHGTSVQRQRWFDKGLESGQVAACDTFAASTL
jgi:hypothetical protein